MVVTGIHVSFGGKYLAPVFVKPPQTIISAPVQTALLWVTDGAPFVLVVIQLSMEGLYLPPVPGFDPPQTSISLPVQKPT